MLKIRGLHTSDNDFLSPEGALQVAKNIVINTPNVAQPRKGFDRLAVFPPAFTYRAEALFAYDDAIIAADYTRQGVVYAYDGSSWTQIGDTPAFSNYVPRPAFSNGNLYLTTSSGIFKWAAATNTALLAGAPFGRPASVSLNSAGSGFLASGDSVAYRIVWGYTDANNNLILGAPSDRTVITNGGGSADTVDLTFAVPSGITTTGPVDWVYRIYRSTAVSTGTPNDELQLTIENAFTGGTSITVTDLTEDADLGGFIYTAASQEGAAAANFQPPLVRDIALYDGTMFYANTESGARLTLTLQDVSIMSNGDTLTLNTTDFTAAAAEDLAAREFFLDASDRDETLKSLIRVINSGAAGFAAQAIGSNGEFVVTNGVINSQTTISATASRPATWLPTTMATTGTDTTSVVERNPNQLIWAKPGEPEAVPLPNQALVGSKAQEVQRIIPLEEALMVFKEDGLYQLTGFYPDYQIELMDSSIQLVGVNTPAVLGNQIYCLTNQGVAKISANNVQIISTPIEDEIFSLYDTQLDNISTYAFGVAREDKRRYYLWYPKASSDTSGTACFVYNTYTKTWTTHDIEARTAFAQNGEFYYSEPDAAYVRQERSTGTNRDYADYSFSTTINAAVDNTITLDSGTDNINIGDILFESVTVYSIVTAVDPINSQVTVASNPGFTTSAVDILSAIPTEIKWIPNALGQPELNKQIHTVTPLFRAGFVGDALLDFSTDISPGVETVTLSGTALLGWGLTSWGSAPWGDTPDRRPYRQWVPRAKQRGNWFTVGFRHAYGFSKWQLQGMKVLGDFGSEKTTK